MFVAFEGIDGSGKSTQLRLLAESLTGEGHMVHETREPSDGPIGQLIRQGMSGRIDLDDRVIAALFIADRLDHLTNPVDGMLGMLSMGHTVLTDRYVLSSLAYHPDYVPMDWIVKGNSLSTELLIPTITVFLDLSPEAACERLSARSIRDRYETLDRLQRVAESYEQAIALLGDQMPVVRIKADHSSDLVAEDVFLAVSAALDR